MKLKYYFLYLDMDTISCTTNDICTILEDISSGYKQVNQSCWVFSYPDGFHGHYTSVEDYIIDENFENFIRSDSIFFITQLENHYNYLLPDSVCDFLNED